MVAPALRVTEGGARVYRRVWRGSIISAFGVPILYLMSMGIGLGRLVDEGDGGLGVPYLTFLAPALLAVHAMQTAAGDASYPVMAGIKWRKIYDAILATPIGVRDLAFGHLIWVTIRVTFVATVFALATVAFGAMTLPRAMMAVLPAVLTGMTFAALITAYTARLESETGLANLFRFAIVPLFLFSGTFFPIEQLPVVIRPLAYATPLWHGVSLSRGLAVETIDFAVHPLVSVAYLLALTALGTVLSIRILRRRLVV